MSVTDEDRTEPRLQDQVLEVIRLRHYSIRTEQHLPVVFTREEVKALLAQLQGTLWLMATLTYQSRRTRSRQPGRRSRTVGLKSDLQ